MSPDKDLSWWTYTLGTIGLVVQSVDTGMRTLLLTAAAGLIAILLGMGYSSLQGSLTEIKTIQHSNYCALDNRLQNVEQKSSATQALVEMHMRNNGNGSK